MDPLLPPRARRPPAFDPDTYTRRDVVERSFDRFKQFRDPATRHEERSAYYRAEPIIAAIILRLR